MNKKHDDVLAMAYIKGIPFSMICSKRTFNYYRTEAAVVVVR